MTKKMKIENPEDFERACKDFSELKKAIYEVKLCKNEESHEWVLHRLDHILKPRPVLILSMDECYVMGCSKCRQIDFKSVVYIDDFG